MMQTSNFERVLDDVEALSVDEQEALIQVVQRRLTERRREEIAATIAQARADYQEGDVFRGTVEQIMNELRQ
jgi:ribosomal protein S1